MLTKPIIGWYPSNGLNGGEIEQLPVNVSLFGTFIDLYNPAGYAYGFVQMFNYIPFVNVMLGLENKNIDHVLNGSLDFQIDFIANAMNAMNLKGFLAFLPEMNGYWTYQKYYYQGLVDEQKYKNAFVYFRERIESIAPNRAQFVFAPNGWSYPEFPFENFYPGDDYVDTLAFSAYNFNTCGGVWETYESSFKPYLDRLYNLAPGKPIILAQTGVLGTDTEKQAWITDTMPKLANSKNFRGTVYFNIAKEEPACGFSDYRAYYPETNTSIGIDTALTLYSYLDKNAPEWNNIFQHVKQTFEDINPVHPWIGQDYAQILYQNNITGGCATNPLRFCPDDAVNRAQLAVFLLRGKYGGSYQPPEAYVQTFTDVSPSHWAYDWIERLYVEGITAGCAPDLYCPTDSVKRVQLAIFILKAKHGVSYSPPPAGSSTGFVDVPVSHWAAPWVKQFALEAGIPSGYFYPDNPVSRLEMAEYLVYAFNLAL